MYDDEKELDENDIADEITHDPIEDDGELRRQLQSIMSSR